MEIADPRPVLGERFDHLISVYLTIIIYSSSSRLGLEITNVEQRTSPHMANLTVNRDLYFTSNWI